MEGTRPAWTDERLDDLSHRVDDRFNQVDDRFNRVDDRFNRVDDRFNRVDVDLRELRTEMNARFDSLEGRLGARVDGLNRSMLQVGGGIIVTVLATMASVIATSA